MWNLQYIILYENEDIDRFSNMHEYTFKNIWEEINK